ncbi:MULTISPECIES: GNAT family N-acetyltransferase [Microbacterium]|nr:MULTISPECIES: GNAT family N-acetyltransferase [Microbacterium]
MKLALRPMIPADAETFASWAEDPVFRAHAGWSQDMTVDRVASWWREIIEHPDPRLVRLAAVDEVGELIGHVDLHDTDGLHDAEGGPRELGFLIGPSRRWRHGWGTAAALAGLDHGFTQLGLSSIWAEAVEANIGSVRVLRRIGMTETGHGTSESFLGADSRYLRFHLSRADWERGSPFRSAF